MGDLWLLVDLVDGDGSVWIHMRHVSHVWATDCVELVMDNGSHLHTTIRSDEFRQMIMDYASGGGHGNRVD